jgi:hypothetical protein
MKVIRWIVWSGLAVASSATMAAESTPDAKRAMSVASGQALQGNIRRALAELDSVPVAEFGTKDRAVRSCMIERFRSDVDGSSPTASGPFADRVIALYQAYWRASLLDPEKKASEEDRLRSELARLTGLPVGSAPARVDDVIKERLAAEGFHALMGRTPPFLELIVWGKQTGQDADVALPEGTHEVRVNVLDEFASLGWSAYATCDRSFTGGWVKPEAVYAVKPGWKSLEDENFRISFLAHETQHLVDKKRFANIESWELEYRGKLAELALADTTVPRLLSAFASNQGDDPDIPHSFANKRVIADLRCRLRLAPAADLGEIGVDAINEAARALLVEDSERRKTGSGPLPGRGLLPGAR